MFQPIIYQGHICLELVEFEQALHGTTMVMSADNDTIDVEGVNGILDRSPFATIRGSVGRYDITRIANDK